MDKEEKEIKDFQEYILENINTIKGLESNDYLKVVDILREILKKFLDFNPRIYMTDLRKSVFESEKKITKIKIADEIKFLENRDSVFLSANFIQTRLILTSIHDSLNF
jgi:hypothetical protein